VERSTSTPADAAELVFAGIERQAALVRAGQVSSRELVEACLGRIERLDHELNAFRVVHGERALAEADQADARARSGDERPLLGVPVAVKDDVDVAGEPTRYGTLAFDAPSERDGDVARVLRAAGAILIGRTTEPELGLWPITESLATGATRNPWALDRTPGGSSGGSAAAVAAGLVGAAVGSDGAGSLRVPGACCGIYGLKPARGRVPGRGYWHGMSTHGGLARTVADAALFLDVVGVGDVPRPASFRAAAATPPGRLRVAVSTKMPPGVLARLAPEQRGAVERAASLLRSLGHEVVERDPDYGPMSTNVTARYLRGVHDDVRRCDRPERLERRTRRMAAIGGLYADPVFARIRAGDGALTARLNRVFDDADVLVTPALGRSPLPVGRLEGLGAVRALLGAVAFTPFTGAWNAAGNPAAAVPVGTGADGLPLAVQVVARQADEATLIALSAQIEAEVGWPDRRPPVG
jgi:amidase